MHILRGIRIMMVRLITRATRHYELRATCFPRGGVPTGTSLLFSMDFVHIMLDCQNIQSDILAKGKSRPIIVVTQTWFQFPGRLFSCFSQNFGEMVESQKWLICWMTKFKMKIWFDIIMLNASTFFFPLSEMILITICKNVIGFDFCIYLSFSIFSFPEALMGSIN